MSLTYEQENSLDGTQKNWTQPVYVNTAQDLISRKDDKRSKVFNAHQGKFGSQWLKVVYDQQLRISIGLRLDANICVAHTCHCGKRIERDSLHGLSCTKSAGRFYVILLSILGHGNKFERISSNFNFQWTKFEFSIKRNKFESLCSNVEQTAVSTKRTSDVSPIHLVPRGPLGPHMFPSC